MPRFRHAHASHPDWRVAVELAQSQLDAQAPQSAYAESGTLGIVYATDALGGHLDDVRDALSRLHPGVRWVGAAVEGVCATGVEYVDAPALALMICALP